LSVDRACDQDLLIGQYYQPVALKLPMIVRTRPSKREAKGGVERAGLGQAVENQALLGMAASEDDHPIFLDCDAPSEFVVPLVGTEKLAREAESRIKLRLSAEAWQRDGTSSLRTAEPAKEVPPTPRSRKLLIPEPPRLPYYMEYAGADQIYPVRNLIEHYVARLMRQTE
jgi:hypothetical protein